MADVARTVGSRFSALLQGEGVTDFDRPLFEHADFLVAPTLGSIVPNWLLIVPREPSLNFRSWKARSGLSPQSLIDKLLSHLGLISDDIIWFEHGPSSAGSIVGCGVDYAHMHVLIRPPFSLTELASEAVATSDVRWQSVENTDAYSNLPDLSSYFVMGSGDQMVFASEVESAGSQFLRRIIAKLTGQPDAWNYRAFDFSENIAATIRNFAELERGANSSE